MTASALGLDQAGQPDGRVWHCQGCRQATDEIRMLLDEGGRPDLSAKLISANVGPVDSLLLWALDPGFALPPEVHKAIALYRQKTWPEQTDGE